jgi:hypothetical protein
MKKNDEDFPKWLFIQGILDGAILQPCLWFHAEQESKNAFPQTKKKKKTVFSKSVPLVTKGNQQLHTIIIK